MFHRTLVLSSVLGLVTSGFTETAQADHRSGVRVGIGIGPGGGFGIGVGRGGSGFYYGSGGYYGGYRPYYGGYGPYNGGYGSYYDYGPSYYGGAYFAPQYYYQQPSYVVPGPTVAVPNPRFDGGEIRLFNPKDAPGPVRYGLNGHVYTMRPGEKQVIRFDRQWVITLLDEREGRPTGPEYSLSTGQFKFKLTDRGWDLVSVETARPAPGSVDARPADPAPIESSSDALTPPPKPIQPKLQDINPTDKSSKEPTSAAPKLIKPTDVP